MNEFSKQPIDDASAEASVPAVTREEEAAIHEEVAAHGNSRRVFLHHSVRKLAYVAPVVMLFHPKPACASSGSQLSNVIEAPASAKAVSKRLGKNIPDRLGKTTIPQNTIPQTVIQQKLQPIQQKLRPPGPGGP
ncbi:MAG: hypothetical protein FWC56_01400 [Phycisphaerae bacterium]|nr:hypothetical protein [Phycisphaerae bacterium]